MVAGELQRSRARANEKPKPCTMPKAKAMIQRRWTVAADDVLQRHVDDGDGDQRLDERREPERVRHEAEGGGDQRDRMRDREGGDDDDERPRRRNGITRQSRNSRWSVPSRMCQKPETRKLQRRLMPARIEAHEAGIAVQLEGAHVLPSGGRKRSAVETRWPKRSTRGCDGEGGALGADRILEQHVEQLLAPVEVELVGEPRAVEMRARLLVGGERAVGRQRDARGGDPRRRQPTVVLVEVDVVDQPELRGVAQGRIGARQVEIAGAAGRKVDVAAWRRSARAPGARAGARPA